MFNILLKRRRNALDVVLREGNSFEFSHIIEISPRSYVQCFPYSVILQCYFNTFYLMYFLFTEQTRVRVQPF